MAIKEVSATSTAGNANADFAVDSNKVYKVLWGEVDLTTDATVANRRVILQVLNSSSTVIASFNAGAVHAASQTNELHQFVPGVTREATAVNNTLIVGIPSDFCLPPSYTLRVDIENGQAGDSYDSHFIVDEKLEFGSTLN